MKNVSTNLNTVLMPLLLLVLMFNQAHADELSVAAANSTCMVLKKIGTLYEREHGIAVNYICKSSGRLAKGLKGKVIKADLFISANKEWMDKMVNANVVNKSAVSTLWGNSLVAVVSKGDPLVIEKWSELASDKVKTIMIGDPGTAPFGRYAKQALQSTGIWASVKGKIVTKKHITLLADAMAESEQGTVGILFSTNLNESMKVVYALDVAWHKPIRYYKSYLTDADNLKNAKSFMQFLRGDSARKLLSDAGFVLSGS